MERSSAQTTRMICMFKAVAFSYLVTLFFLLVIAFLMLQTGMSGGVVTGAVVATYIISVFLGSFYLGKHVDEKRFLWGLLAAIIYFSIYVIISLMINSNEAVRIGDYIKTLLLIAFSGMLGGMLS